jgi:hypothetical protein
MNIIIHPSYEFELQIFHQWSQNVIWEKSKSQTGLMSNPGFSTVAVRHWQVSSSCPIK